MTTRIGQPERPPSVRSISRSLSSTNVVQRPSPHRSLSQQLTTSSPSRKTTSDGFLDIDGPDGTTRTIPRSRLNLEIGKSTKIEDLTESPKPMSDLTPTWKPSQPPRGRPQQHFDVPIIGDSSQATSELSQHGGVIKPMPLPVRPGQHAPPIHIERNRQATLSLGKKDARPKPYTLEVPAAAPHYAPNGHVDFYPWTGNHPEDQFSESAIRQGYYDKAQMTQNETGSARSAIFPALKNKSGLQTLSSLFTSVLAQRRSHGRITSSSTFKPPPRVTVTDTKREMWLKDLANPTIPLRRLSRSIPHGIRGKVLLDQSLSKNIPIERAVWLAKCVGANELRSFRRKGASGTFAMGGEAKWIRDFTICVEQFVESIVGLCGEKDFKTKINYAIRLATYFHAEYLLDREHYMDWLVSSLEQSTQAKLPMWLLITQVYWKDVLQYRKYGRRLSAGLLSHLAETLNHPDGDILAPLSKRLEYLLKGVITSSPNSFLLPSIWSKYEDMLLSSVVQNDRRLRSLMTDLSRRNRRLLREGESEQVNSRRSLIKLLDLALSSPLSNESLHQIWDMDRDKDVLTRTVLDWATSPHRPGSCKTFVATRIFRIWSKLGVDITDVLLNFAGHGSCDTSASKFAFYHLVSELARSGQFSTARYLQWLIARGGVSDPSHLAEDGPCATRLLVELPTHNLSDSIAELRTTMLSRADFVVEAEEDYTNACIVAMNSTFSGMHSAADSELGSSKYRVPANITELLSNANRTIKSEAGLWLRQKVKLHMIQPTIPPLDDWDDSLTKSGTSAILLKDFNTVRHYIALTDDYSMLADILKLVSSSKDAEVLASVADTINLHLNIFAAIGAIKDLFELLATRMSFFNNDRGSIPRVLLVSMSDLASRLPEQKVVAQQLSQELARSDRKTAADACSPASDHMALMQTDEADCTDEIEKVLASGNTMDQATLERLFQRIIDRLQESFDKPAEHQRSCTLLLTRLRTFDAKHFHTLMNTWLVSFLQMRSRPAIIQILGPLVSFGCLNLLEIITTLNTMEAKDYNSITFRDARETLDLIIPSFDVPEAMSAAEAYRLRLKQAQLQTDSPREVLRIIARTVQGSHYASSEECFSLLERTEMRRILQSLVLVDADLLIRELIVPLLGTHAKAVELVVEKLLLRQYSTSSTATEDILTFADDLTLPFCQVKLATMFDSSDCAMIDAEEAPSARLEAFDSAIESAVSAGRTSWASIIPLLDISIANHLRQRSERQFLASFPTANGSSMDSSDSCEQLKRAKNLLHLIDATSYSISGASSTPDQSNTILEITATWDGMWGFLTGTSTQMAKQTIITSWLPLLLSFTTMYKHTFELTKSGHEHRGRVILALAGVFLQLQGLGPSTKDTATLIEHTYDLSLFLVDSLPDDLRLQCIKYLGESVSGQLIKYLFSFSNNPSEWLVLVQREKPAAGVTRGNPNNAPGSGGEGKGAERERAKPVPYPLRRWEMLGEPTPNVGENDTSLSLTLFGARRG